MRCISVDDVRIAVIPAYNDEKSIASIVLGAKQYVDRVIVVDDASYDNTAKIAKLAGAEVVRLERNMGAQQARLEGFKKALESKPDIIVTFLGDGFEDPEDVPIILAPIEQGMADLVLSDPPFRFQVYSEKALRRLIDRLSKLTHYGTPRYVAQLENEARRNKLRLQSIPLSLEGRSPLTIFDEISVEKVRRISTMREVYVERRKTQKNLSKTQSYKIISETFLKFIPPALLSLIVSATILVPATGVNLDIRNIALIVIATVIAFILCWFLLVRLLDREYRETDYLRALGARQEEIDRKKQK